MTIEALDKIQALAELRGMMKLLAIMAKDGSASQADDLDKLMHEVCITLDAVASHIERTDKELEARRAQDDPVEALDYTR